MTTPAPIRFASLLLALAATLSVLLLGSVMASAARASEPAVKQLNGRALARYDYIHINSSDVFRFRPPPTVNASVTEEDIDRGFFQGVLTIPLQHAVGLRALVAATTSKRHPDQFEETKSGGLEIGADLFVRNPEVGEAGIGPRYRWDETTTGQVDRSNHAAGVAAYGTLFLDEFLFGPMDLGVNGRFLDADIDSDGAFSAEREYSAGGRVTTYVSDRVAVGVGGSWSRTNFGTGEHVEYASADFDLDLLLPTPLPVTLGAGFSYGKQEVGSLALSNYGREFFSLGFSLTVSFVDAQSLLELNRFYY